MWRSGVTRLDKELKGRKTGACFFWFFLDFFAV
jgi:hypothetical protein